jgi:hypothetical protein
MRVGIVDAGKLTGRRRVAVRKAIEEMKSGRKNR